MHNHSKKQSNWLVALAMVALSPAVLSAGGCSSPEAEIPSGPNLDAAKAAAAAVGAVIDGYGKPLDELLTKLEAGVPAPEQLTPTLAAARSQLLDNAPIIVYGAKQRFVASDALPDGPPMTKYLLPAVRKAMDAGKPLITDVWHDVNKRPWVTLVRVRGAGEKMLAAATVIRVDSQALDGKFGALPMGSAKHLQLLDGAGLAVWSVDAKQRYKSAVHGTYLIDRLRLGEPVQTRCHACHEGPDKQVVREDIVVTAVPVQGSNWSVAVH